MTYVLLTGAIKNVGDFLILSRTKKLIEKFTKRDYVVIEAWKPLDNHLELINESDAVIICGGPGVQSNFYPNVYPLTRNLDDIMVPLILLGTGWYDYIGDDISLNHFNFSSTSLKALKKLSLSSDFISCRDYLTKKILIKHGFTKVLMTGCPAWYDLNFLNKPFNTHVQPKKIVFTPAQNRLYFEQSIKIMKLLKSMFPYATLYCSFHRGWDLGGNTTEEEANRFSKLRTEALKLGYKVVNAAYDLSNIDFYKQCDLHIGYRLHGHVAFLSQRKPSFLLCEDSRGRGFSEAVGLPGIRAWSFGFIGNSSRKIIEFLKQTPLLKKSTLLANTFQSLPINPNKFAPLELKTLIESEIEHRFETFKELDHVFQRHFKEMVLFLQSLP